ncbi:chromosome segregation protein SMC [Peptostreptococcus anaerobius]|uniref:chromosome segregation protein SMC n=1 Tax=Peptostreptococcus anaerobius TaxID=1261 RepID=UPI0029039B4F|nr:chromosome segregation protein SMC [Peptostreptococcus anaerobius]MDU1175434.1 chromosome segregation protein SMC [Peptostreptococcus anaerobius]MDU1233942.1 chromosome segregation protein SMC [Peptostreptococcus anaerobius]
MYLKKLELKGFKSFPMKTDIFFDKGVTAIVGPNGSGKSNISDAVRWVLGEQSIKSLRGEKMEDVIFSGTDSKKAMNYCEVAITLDNSNGEIDIDSNELVIKRKAYRTGESNFYINGKSCRLKDIREILMDTGIGKDGYSIIEQGKVEDILSNNPANRRKIFDEACGIAKYRYKKNEAERNLKKSSENLERINDIFEEVDKQLKPLERQQVKAKKYIVLRDELKILEINDFINKNKGLEEEISQYTAKIQEISKEMEILGQEKFDLEEDLVSLSKEIDELEILLDKMGEDNIDMKTKISYKKSEIQVSKEKVKFQEGEIERKKNEIKLADKKIEVDNIELDKVHKRADEKSYEIESIEESMEDIFNQKIRLEKVLEDLDNKINDSKSTSISLLEKRENISQDFARVGANIDNMKARLEDIGIQIDDLNKEIGLDDKDIDSKNLELEDLSKDLDKITKTISEKSLELKDRESDYRAKTKSQQDLNYSIASLRSKHNTYVDMENHHEGFNRGVKEVLKNKNIKGIRGAFGELVSVPQKYEKAIEASLGAAIQNVVVEDEASAKTAISYLKKNNLGRVTFLPMNVMRPNKLKFDRTYKTDYIGICSDLIQYSKEYTSLVENLLGRVVLVEDIDRAVALAREAGHRFKIVTLEGDIVNPGGALTGGSLKVNSNILSRKRIINELDLEIKSKEKDKLNLENTIRESHEYIEDLEKEIEVLRNSKLGKDRSRIGLETELKILTESKSNKKKNIESYKEESSKIRDSIESSKKIYDECQNTLESISIESKDNTSNIEDLVLEHKKANLEFGEVVKVYNEKNLDLVREKEAFKNLIEEISRISNDIDESKDRQKKLGDSIAENENELNFLDELIEKYEKELVQMEANLEEMSQTMVEKRLEKDDLRIGYDEKKRLAREKDRSYNNYREENFNYESKLDRARVASDNILTNLYEKYDLTYVQAMDYRDQELEVDLAKIEKLKKSIKNLGNVNLDSIDEYEEIKERHEFYSSQKLDLEESIESLNGLIDDLVEKMKKEFLDSFKIINDNFKKVYKSLFEGGNADLKISDYENVLSCDIEITAQPPGKKMKNLSLLSGGEKAMTAICILFAILISKPTPFCILDEIEAPLDDVNVYRFGAFLKDLSSGTQFVAVTHRRGTMEVADYIYGITMQEKGVSSVISIRLNEAEKMIES